MTSLIFSSILFADDTNFLYSHKDLNELLEIVNRELEKITHWFKANKFSLNIEKTSYLLFGKSSHEISSSVKIDNNIIMRVYDVTFLGVLIDSVLSWKKQNELIENKISKG